MAERPPRVHERLRELPSVDRLTAAVARAELADRRAEVDVGTNRTRLADNAAALTAQTGAIAACRRHPLARAVRIDKRSLAALEATLRVYRDPARARRAPSVLAMLDVDPAALQARAERPADGSGGTVVRASAKVGGGALPLLELPGPAIALDPGPAGADALAAPLRAGDPPLVGRIQDGRRPLYPRTLTDEEADLAAAAVRAARSAP